MSLSPAAGVVYADSIPVHRRILRSLQEPPPSGAANDVVSSFVHRHRASLADDSPRKNWLHTNWNRSRGRGWNVHTLYRVARDNSGMQLTPGRADERCTSPVGRCLFLGFYMMSFMVQYRMLLFYVYVITRVALPSLTLQQYACHSIMMYSDVPCLLRFDKFDCDPYCSAAVS